MCASDLRGAALRSRRLALLFALFLAFAAIPPSGITGCLEGEACGRQAITENVIPGDGFSAGWKKSDPLRTFISEDLFNHIDGGAELFLEFGFSQLFVQSYSDGTSELTASVYRMNDATAALGVYLMKMGKETPFPEIAARNSSEAVQSAILKGRYFIQVDNFGDSPAPRSAAVALANAVLALVPDEAPGPVLDRLPVEGRVPGSERLIRGQVGLQPYYTFGEGDVLLLNGEVFAALAEYRTSGGAEYTRLMIAYPDAAAASAALENVRTNLDPYLKPIESKPLLLTFIDFQKKFGRLELAGNVLDIRFKLTSLD